MKTAVLTVVEKNTDGTDDGTNTNEGANTKASEGTDSNIVPDTISDLSSSSIPALGLGTGSTGKDTVVKDGSTTSESLPKTGTQSTYLVALVGTLFVIVGIGFTFVINRRKKHFKE